MKIINIQPKTKIILNNIEGFLKNRVTPYGTGAKVDCLKRYLGQEVYLIILKNESRRRSKISKRRIDSVKRRK